MKYLLLLLSSCFILSCTETTTDFEVKRLSKIRGKRTEIADSTVFQLVSFSGYDVQQKEVSPQIIARCKKDDRLYRIIVLPMFADYPVNNTMSFRIADKLNLEALKTISEAELPASTGLNEAMEEGIRKSRTDFTAAKIDNYLKRDEEKIKVFFNPAKKEFEDQELPIIIGWVE